MNTKNQLGFMAFFVLVALMVMLWGPMAVGSQEIQGGSSFTTAFTYQGILEYEGEPVDGNEAFSFRLYDAESGGKQIGNAITIPVVPVSNGIFTVELDFGPGSFDEGPRWLEVVTAAAGILEPRQLVNPAPYVGDLLARVEALEAENAALQELLAGVTRENVGGYDTLVFSEMNVQVVNGTGSTGGDPNGLGNLIVGYNQMRSDLNFRTGSHYVVIGDRHNYSGYGGIIAGFTHTVSGNYASVSGGYLNTATNNMASVSGGIYNQATGIGSSVSGGSYNTASGNQTSVSGGRSNTASGAWASISGGHSNTARSYYTSISGCVVDTAGNRRRSLAAITTSVVAILSLKDNTLRSPGVNTTGPPRDLLLFPAVSTTQPAGTMLRSPGVKATGPLERILLFPAGRTTWPMERVLLFPAGGITKPTGGVLQFPGVISTEPRGFNLQFPAV